MRLLSPATPAQQAVLDLPYYRAAHSAVHLSLAAEDRGVKLAGESVTSYGLAGRLYLSQSGWLLLSVPNALGRGAFDALDEHGAQLPTRDTDDPAAVFNAHITVMSPADIAQLGGPDKITERGHMFRYTLGPVKEITPTTWNGVSRCWAIECYSPELKALRKSYGLSPLPGSQGDHEFHITFAIRRKKVLQPGEVSKAAGADWDEKLIKLQKRRGERCQHCEALFEKSEDGYCNSCGHDFDTGKVPEQGLYHEGTKAASGDMLAFKAWKATGLSDEEADRKAGESLELPDPKVTPRIKSKKVIEQDVETCPHCNQEIGEKEIYVDDDGYEHHRGCDQGPIGRLGEGMRKWIREARGLDKGAGLREDIDAAAAQCEEPKSEEQARAGNYRHGHCTLHGMPITIETGKGMTRKGTDKNGKPWSITMAHHYGYIKRTESEADGDHIDVFIGPDPESEIVFVVDQEIDGKFDEHKCMLGFTSKEAAKAGYLACYDDGWKGCGSITSLTIPQFKAWCKDGNTGKPLAGQKLTHKQAALDAA